MEWSPTLLLATSWVSTIKNFPKTWSQLCFTDDALARVLVDNMSSLNVRLKRTLFKLSFQGPSMRFRALVVKAFDGSKRTLIGDVELPTQIGPHVFQITFYVMDINHVYNFLLGRPCIHVAGVVSSTLQTHNYIWWRSSFGQSFILLLIYWGWWNALETSFQTLEITNAT